MSHSKKAMGFLATTAIGGVLFLLPLDVEFGDAVATSHDPDVMFHCGRRDSHAACEADTCIEKVKRRRRCSCKRA
jgi:hypothetical protein